METIERSPTIEVAQKLLQEFPFTSDELLHGFVRNEIVAQSSAILADLEHLLENENLDISLFELSGNKMLSSSQTSALRETGQSGVVAFVVLETACDAYLNSSGPAAELHDFRSGMSRISKRFAPVKVAMWKAYRKSYEAEEAQSVFEFMLGRRINSRDDMNARSVRGFPEDLRRLIQSPEFLRNLRTISFQVTADEAADPPVVDHDALAELKTSLAYFFARLPFSAEELDRLSACTTRDEALKRLLLSPTFVELLRYLFHASPDSFENNFRLFETLITGTGGICDQWSEISSGLLALRISSNDIRLEQDALHAENHHGDKLADISYLYDNIFLISNSTYNTDDLIDQLAAIRMASGGVIPVAVMDRNNTATNAKACEARDKAAWHLNHGRVNQAIDTLNRALKEYPTHTEVQLNHLKYLALGGRTNEVLDRIAEIEPLLVAGEFDVSRLLLNAYVGRVKQAGDDQTNIAPSDVKSFDALVASAPSQVDLSQITEIQALIYEKLVLQGNAEAAHDEFLPLKPDEKTAILTFLLSQPIEKHYLSEFLLLIRAFSSLPLEKYTTEILKGRDDKHIAIRVMSLIGIMGKQPVEVCTQVFDLLDSESDPNRVKDTVDQIIKADKASAADKFHIARKLQRLGLLNEAVPIYRSVVKDFWGRVDRLVQIAKAEYSLYQKEGYSDGKNLKSVVDRSFDLVRNRLLTEPGNDQWRYLLADIFALREEFPRALEVLNDLVARYPDEERYRVDRLRLAEKASSPDTILEDAQFFKNQGKYDSRIALREVKAHRMLDQAAEANQILAEHWREGGLEIATEYVRNFFFEANFDAADKACQEVTAIYGEHPSLSLLECAICYERGEYEKGLMKALILAQGSSQQMATQDLPLMLYAMLHKLGREEEALAQLDPLFASMGYRPIRLASDGSGKPFFDRLTGAHDPLKGYEGEFKPVFNGPLVTVVMTSYNSEQYIETAVKSIIAQSYRNLEMIVVDDCSTDGTRDILRRLERQYQNLRVILKSTNDGTYVSKNMGIMQARGDIIALQDSDDWSHPDRIAKSVSMLMNQKNVVALTTDWLRMSTDGQIVVKAGGQISHVCCISIVFWRQKVLDMVGLYDSVRIEADMEYIRRMNIVFGADKVLRLRWPLLFGRAHPDSLTASEEYGITRTGFTEPRQQYQASYKAWHNTLMEGQKAVLPFPMLQRSFEAPALMLPERIKKS